MSERARELALELRLTIHPLTQQGEDYIWRRAEKACALLDDLEAALAGETRETGWQGIESAPRDGTEVLLTVQSTAKNDTYGLGGKVVVMTACYEDDEWFDGGCVRVELHGCWEATHWMPLPPAPAIRDLSRGEGE